RPHGVAGGLGQGAPVLEFAVQRGGGQERGQRGGVGHGVARSSQWSGGPSGFWAPGAFRGGVRQVVCVQAVCVQAVVFRLCGVQADCGNGSAMGSVGTLLRPWSSKRSRPRPVVSTTAEKPVWARSAAARATPG